MICPKCGSQNDAVDKTLSDGDIIWRLRKCKSCKHEWETSEVEDERLGQSVKAEYWARQNAVKKTRA